MERPKYDEVITTQNETYAIDVIERYHDQPKIAATVLAAITEAFILGAGGYRGSFDAAYVLESGGLSVLIESLGIADIDINMSDIIDEKTFEKAVRESVDYGASWDDLELEIPPHAINDTSITGSDPLAGPLSGQFVISLGEEPPDLGD